MNPNLRDVCVDRSTLWFGQKVAPGTELHEAPRPKHRERAGGVSPTAKAQGGQNCSIDSPSLDVEWFLLPASGKYELPEACLSQ